VAPPPLSIVLAHSHPGINSIGGIPKRILEERMRKLLIVCGLLLIGAAAVNAQESRGFDVSGTYQYVRVNPGSGSDGINCQGGSGSVGAYLSARIGVIGEF